MDKIGESPAFSELADKYEHSFMRSAAAVCLDCNPLLSCLCFYVQKLGRSSIFPNKV